MLGFSNTSDQENATAVLDEWSALRYVWDMRQGARRWVGDGTKIYMIWGIYEDTDSCSTYSSTSSSSSISTRTSIEERSENPFSPGPLTRNRRKSVTDSAIKKTPAKVCRRVPRVISCVWRIVCVHTCHKYGCVRLRVYENWKENCESVICGLTLWCVTWHIHMGHGSLMHDISHSCMARLSTTYDDVSQNNESCLIFCVTCHTSVVTCASQVCHVIFCVTCLTTTNVSCLMTTNHVSFSVWHVSSQRIYDDVRIASLSYVACLTHEWDIARKEQREHSHEHTVRVS